MSLNLCTDELLLMLGSPEQIASVTHLAHRSGETPLWRQARRHHANDGTRASAAPLRPDLVIDMGRSGGRLGTASRLAAESIDLPFPRNLDDVAAAVRTVAAALGREAVGAAMVARIEALRRSAPPARMDALWIGGGGRTVAASGLEAEWMALAGMRQREVRGDRIGLEELLIRPPAILLRSNYRQDQYSRSQSWLDHPLVRAARTGRTIVTDGRLWTCMGPTLIEEIERLRREQGV